MLLTKLKTGAVWLLAGLLIIGSGAFAYHAATDQSGADGLSREAQAQARGDQTEDAAKKGANHGNVAPKSWFEGTLAQLEALAVPGKKVFGRIKLQNAEDAFNLDITTETRISRMVGDKQKPAQF